MNNQKYTKGIRVIYDGGVIAEVFGNGKSRAHKIFQRGFFESTNEKMLIRANKWADDLIKLLEKYEINSDKV